MRSEVKGGDGFGLGGGALLRLQRRCGKQSVVGVTKLTTAKIIISPKINKICPQNQTKMFMALPRFNTFKKCIS